MVQMYKKFYTVLKINQTILLKKMIFHQKELQFPLSSART